MPLDPENGYWYYFSLIKSKLHWPDYSATKDAAEKIDRLNRRLEAYEREFDKQASRDILLVDGFEVVTPDDELGNAYWKLVEKVEDLQGSYKKRFQTYKHSTHDLLCCLDPESLVRENRPEPKAAKYIWELNISPLRPSRAGRLEHGFTDAQGS